MKHDVPHADGGTVPLIRPGVRLSDTPLEMRSAAPVLGADNAALLGTDGEQ
jgi:crotonobetainyl-CoA:carnitine CoA-transferase CaiB-like acyl-CoA transferase